MKRLNKEKMENVNAGMKCIYHALFAMTSINLAYSLISGDYSNYKSVAECWNNRH